MIQSIDYTVNKEKVKAVILFILDTLGRVDIYKLGKIIYFADQKHLTRFGRPITGDWYAALQDGPVPSNIYDFLKGVRDSNPFQKVLKNKIIIKGPYWVYPLAKPDLDELSLSDLDCLKESIEENKDLSFQELKHKSHGFAYSQAKPKRMIAFTDIAKEGGADEGFINYIVEAAQNKNLSLNDSPAT